MAFCPIKLKTRSVLIRTQAVPGTGETTLGQADNINVTGVSVSHVATEIDRSDVYTPNGSGLPALQAGRKWNFEITQEFYKTPTRGSKAGWQHQALFEAGPFKITEDPLGTNGVKVTQSAGTCWGTDVKPATVEIVEVGGNVYRSIDCIVENVEISATPNQKVVITWTLSGQFVAPTDSTKGPFMPSSIIPSVYRGASLLWGGTKTSETCPAFTLGFGMSTSEVETACSSTGNIMVADFDTPVELAFSGALAVKESVYPVWDDMITNREDTLDFKFDNDYMEVKLAPAQLTSVAITETNSYVGNDLTFQNAGVWTIEVDGVALPTP